MSYDPTYEVLAQKIKEVKKTLARRKSPENGLKKGKEKYKAIFECVLDCIYIYDFEGNFIDANDAALSLLGYKRDEISSLSFGSLLSQNQIPLALEALDEIKKTGFQKGFTELKLHDRDGNNVCVETKSSVIYQDSEPWAILVTARDITKGRQADELLVKKITELHTFINTIPDMAWLKDADSCFIDVNEAFCKAAGMPREALINHTCEVCFGAQAAKKFREDDLRVMDGGKKVIIEEKIIDSQQNEVWLETIKSPIFDESGKAIGTIGIARDITKRKRMEDALHNAYDKMEQRVKQRTAELEKANERLKMEVKERIQTENELKKFQFALESAHDAIFYKDLESRYVIANKKTLEAFGLSKEEIIGKNDYDLMPNLEEARKNIEDDQTVFRTGKPTEAVKHISGAHGNEFWFQTIKVPLFDINGNVVGLVGIARDITERKRAEDQIAASLKEKEVLLREIHHRVKNNMQSIISLLRIHSRRTNDTHLRRIFDECRDRINAMSLIHETLYQSEDLARIDFENYLTKLCRSLSQAHGASGKGIAVTVERCNVSPNMDQGIAVGMVICELIANAFQHAFPSGKGGKVSISLSGLEGEQVEMIVSDDGKGLPPEIDILNSPSLGLQLAVATVTRELGGSISVERNSGTRFIIRFNCKSS